MKKSKFEMFLELKHELGAEHKDVLAQLTKKTISEPVKNSADLVAWLNEQGGFQLITTLDQLELELAKFNLAVTTGIDIETMPTCEHPKAGLLPVISKIRTVQLYQPGCCTLVIDLSTVGYMWLPKLHAFRDLVAFNAKFEMSHLNQILAVPLFIRCAMLALRPFVLMSNDLSKSMGSTATLSETGEINLDPSIHLALTNIKISKDLQTSNWARPELFPEQVAYAAADAVCVYLMDVVLAQYIKGDSTAARIVYFLGELDAAVAAQSPLSFEWEGHSALVNKWQSELDEVRADLKECGLDDPSKVASKRTWIESFSGRGNWPRTPNGSLQCSKEVLEAKAIDYPQVQLLVAYNHLSSRLANYGHKLKETAIEGQLYPQFRTAATATYRFTCSSPAVQIFPQEMRELVVPAPGTVFVASDLNQIEMRVVGELSREQIILSAPTSGTDLHAYMGSIIARVPLAAVTPDIRKLGKIANFSLLYGCGAARLVDLARDQYKVELSIEDAQNIQRSFKQGYPRIALWQKATVAKAEKSLSSHSTHFKLSRTYPYSPYSDALNYPVQSTAFEVLALALIYIHQNKPEGNVISTALHVHDEIVLQAKVGYEIRAAKLLTDAWAHAWLAVFPGSSAHGLAEVGISARSWSATKEKVNLIQNSELDELLISEIAQDQACVVF